jgi:hypothetical protein
LKDPRWQKKRLEILNASNWTCDTCDATKKTLHVHHAWYEWGKEPWDYPNESLSCLCEDCHASAELDRVELLMHLNRSNLSMLELIGYMKAEAFDEGVEYEFDTLEDIVGACMFLTSYGAAEHMANEIIRSGENVSEEVKRRLGLAVAR